MATSCLQAAAALGGASATDGDKERKGVASFSLLALQEGQYWVPVEL